MRHLATSTALAMLCLTAPRAHAQATEPNCADILRFGVFDEHTFQADTNLRTRFEQALCNTDFGTYQEARNYGIGVGVPVYGVPVQISGSFDEAKKREWFKQHCEATKSAADFTQFVADRTRTASPTITEAWTKCVMAEIDTRQTGLRCSVTRPTALDAVFSATWLKGNKNDGGPKIELAETFGGSCDNAPQGAQLIDGLSLKCHRRSERESIAFLLRAENSQCLLVVPGFDRSCNERRFKAADNGTPANTIDADTRIACARITFEAGAVITIRHGSRVEFAATDSIAVVGDGGATIDGTGDTGAVGANAPNRTDSWSSQGDDDYWAARHDVEGNDNHPDRGRAGKDGSRGGKGAALIFTKQPTGQLTCKAPGGEGGAGGQGGSGKLLRNGRNNYCNGCTYDRRGPSGAQGAPGDAGSCTFLERTPSDPSAGP